jgi:hypothetical protein
MKTLENPKSFLKSNDFCTFGKSKGSLFTVFKAFNHENYHS